MLAMMTRPAIGARLGDILIGWGRVTRKQLEQALLMQHRTTERLGSLLVRAGLLTEEDLLAALAAQANLPYLSDAALLAQEIPGPLLLRVPRKYAEKLGVLPLALQGRILFVASSEPDTPAHIDDIRFVASVAQVSFVLVTERALNQAIAAAYADAR